MRRFSFGMFLGFTVLNLLLMFLWEALGGGGKRLAIPEATLKDPWAILWAITVIVITITILYLVGIGLFRYLMITVIVAALVLLWLFYIQPVHFEDAVPSLNWLHDAVANFGFHVGDNLLMAFFLSGAFALVEVGAVRAYGALRS